MSKKFTGYLHSPRSIKDHIAPKITPQQPDEVTKTLSTLPTKVDNRSWQTKVYDQLDLGSCVAHSKKSQIEAMIKRIKGITTDLSALYIYYAARVGIEGWPANEDTGLFMRGALDAVRRFGVPPTDKWEYDPSQFHVQPDWIATGYADDYVPLRYFRLDFDIATNPQACLTRLKDYLSRKIVWDFGFNVYDSIFDDDTGVIPFPSNNESLAGGHAVLAVGYDDNKLITNHRNETTVNGAFLIKNSWGTGWGEKGYGWIPYKYFLEGQADDIWTIESSSILKPLS